jgi:hypothetical protein
MTTDEFILSKRACSKKAGSRLRMAYNSIPVSQHFACAGGQFRAKPQVFCKHAAKTIMLIKK